MSRRSPSAVTYAGAAPLPEQEAHWHERAHDACFIAKSVKTEVLTEIQPACVAPVTAPGDR
jgi:organic hydroperoxide reductase OsmC/OhrA